MSTTTASSPRVGELLRDWRRRRHLSQLDLSVEAEVSARHLSFVETGRSKPSRELLLHLAEHLEVPLRERNALLARRRLRPRVPGDAAGCRGDGAGPGGRFDKILAGHEPYPALVVDSALGPGLGQRVRLRAADRRRGPRPPGRRRSTPCG